jgi:hypothetical protein
MLMPDTILVLSSLSLPQLHIRRDDPGFARERLDSVPFATSSSEGKAAQIG